MTGKSASQKNYQGNMADSENDELPMLSETRAQPYDEGPYDEPLDSKFRRLVSRTQSAPISIPKSSMKSYERQTSRSERKSPFMQMNDSLYATPGTGNLLQQRTIVTGNKAVESKAENFATLRDTDSSYWNNNYDVKNEYLLRSGQLGMCNDPYCTTCPTYFKASQLRTPEASNIFDPKFHSALDGDAKGFLRKPFSFCPSYVPGVMNPHTKVVQQWNKILAISCLVAIFVDPLFYFLLYVQQDYNCIDIDWTMTTALVSLRSINDLVYFFNILLQFRLAYVSPESRVLGTGDLVDHPKKIALHYLKGYFLFDLFVVLPLPQITILFVLPNSLSGTNYAKNLLRAAMLVQYIPRLFRFLPLLSGQSPTGFIFESAWANFIINILMFLLAGHVVGSCWYLLSLQRVDQCLRDACHNSNITGCMKFIECGHSRTSGQTSTLWNNNADAIACLNSSSGQFSYGIYVTAVPLNIETNVVNKYVYSLFWGFQFHNALYGDAKGFARKLFSFCSSYVPGVMNPHAKFVQQWNKFLAFFCVAAIFVDPLFFFILYVQPDHNCIVIDWKMTTVLVSLRSINDLVYFFNILLQFRLAYVSPESRVVGAGDLVDHPKKIALHYLKGYFLFDLFVVIPLPQIMMLFVLPNSLGGANYAKNLLRAAILVQYIPRLFRFLPLLFGQSPSGFIFESARANFIMNLLIFMLASHVVGSCWYLFGLQRVNQCLRDACHSSNIPNCMDFIDCGHGRTGNDQSGLTSEQWNNNTDAINCWNPPSSGGFPYGIYANAVPLTTETNVVNKYVYSLFWGLQQISTYAGNQTPSRFVWEVLFTMTIIGLGLLLFALLIGNIQNFLQALGRRRLEMQLRRRDVEQWMSHRRLPGDLRRRVRQAERYNWAATRGVNEEILMENLPEDLQRDIRRHLFKFVKKVRIFALMDEPILDAICERLRQKTYIKGSKILREGGLVEKMIFVVRGKLESIGKDGTRVPLSEGDACGEELLTWYLEHSSVSSDGRKVRLPGQGLLSNRTVSCLTNVEAFTLRAADLEEVTILFTRFLRSPRVQGALRYESPYWRSLAATRIQVAWRYRKKRLSRADSSQSNY